VLQSRNKSSKSRRSKPSAQKATARHGSRWSASVTRHSNALDLQRKIFKSTNPRRIALSLKRSAETSKRRKGTPYQSAMSMLNFYVNRAGKSLPKKQKRVLERAKDELRGVFGRS
jgi:putative cell wall-binding protein